MSTLDPLKKPLRVQAREQRTHFYHHHRTQHKTFSKIIVTTLHKLIESHPFRTIMGYYPIRDEIDIRPFLLELHKNPNITLALPRTRPPTSAHPEPHPELYSELYSESHIAQSEPHSEPKLEPKLEPNAKPPSPQSQIASLLPGTRKSSPAAQQDHSSPSTPSNINPDKKKSPNEMVPIAVTKGLSLDEQLYRGRYGIMEVREGKILSPVAIDVIIVPGLLFDERGHRLGYGGGYYDHFIHCATTNRPKQAPTLRTLGVFFQFQKQDRLPEDPHDKRLHSIITEKGVYHCASFHSPSPS